MARFAAKMASCYPSDPARCALNDAVFEMAQVEMVEMGGSWWFRVVVNPGENAAEGLCVYRAGTCECPVFFLDWRVNPPKEKLFFFSPIKRYSTFILRNWIFVVWGKLNSPERISPTFETLATF